VAMARFTCAMVDSEWGLGGIRLIYQGHLGLIANPHQIARDGRRQNDVRGTPARMSLTCM